MSTAASGARAVRFLATAYLIFAVAFAVFCTVASLRGHYTVPNVDDWRILDNLFSQPLLEWIFTDQVGHRLPTTLLLLYLDYTYFSGHMHLLTIAALACAWIAAGALVVAMRAASGPLSPADRAACGFCLFCVFWAGTGYDFVWGVNQGSQQTVALFALSLAAFARYQSRRAGPANAGAALPAVAATAAFLATFSHGMGAASWAGLTFASLVGRLRWRWIAAFVVIGAASIFLYGRGLEHIPHGTFWIYVRYVRRAPVPIATFWMTLMGNPIGDVVTAVTTLPARRLLGVGTVVGAAGLAWFAAYALSLSLRRARPDAVESVCAGLMAFTVAGGVLVALNRFMFPANALANRFLTWTTLFWVGAVLAAIRLARRRPWGDWFAVAVLWALSLAMLPAVRHAFAWQTGIRLYHARQVAMHLSGVRWDNLARVGANPRSDPVYRVVERLRRERRSFFSDGRGELPGSRLAERFAVRPERACAGVIERTQEITARDGPAALVGGTLTEPVAGEAPSYVVFGDAAGVIRGVGELLPGVSGPERWVGFINGFAAGQRYTAYGVLDEQRAVCRIGAWPP